MDRQSTDAKGTTVGLQPLPQPPSLEGIPLVCPYCRQAVQSNDGGYVCADCQKTFPLCAGIPDFRVFEDPYLSIEEDRERTDIVLSGLSDCSMVSLLDYYWSYSDITPVPLQSKYILSVMRGKKKAARTVRQLTAGEFRQSPRPQRVLDIGSGSGAFLAAASGQFDQVLGIDIAMRWLHLSRSRFVDEDLPAPPLICSCCESLPFPNDYFDLIVATSVLEFTKDPAKVFEECARVLTPQGVMFISTVNRYSLAIEPHCYLWGVGFLPRRWQARYVYIRKRACYDNIRLLSYWELGMMSQKAFPYRRICNQGIDENSLKVCSGVTRALVYIYRYLNRIPLVTHVLRWFGPGWEAEFRKQR